MSDISKIEFTKLPNLKDYLELQGIDNIIGQCVFELAPFKKSKEVLGWYDLKTNSLVPDLPIFIISPDLNKPFGVNTAKIDYYKDIVDSLINSTSNFNKASLKEIINKFKAENKNILRIYTKLENNNVEKYLYRIKYLRSKKLINKLIRLKKRKKFMLQ